MAEILILTLVFPPDNVSTAQLMADLAEDLMAKGHRITVLTTLPHYNQDAAASAAQPIVPYWGVVLQRSSYRGIEVYHAWMPDKGKNKFYRMLTWASFHLISTIAGLIRVRRPEIILCPSPPLTIGLSAWILSAFRGSRFIYNVQELYPDMAINLGAVRNRWVIHSLYKLERFVYRNAAAVTVISARMRRRLLEKGVPAGKVALIPNFVDVDSFRLLPKENEFGRMHGLHGKFVVTYAGNMGKPQHLETFLEAAALLQGTNRVHFVLMGNGSERERLVNLAAELQLRNVTFLAQQPYSSMPLAYASSDASYVPQAMGTSSDGVPSKVYRIMAAGCPVVACTDADSDLADLISVAAAGVVVTTADPADLAKVIREAFVNEDDWHCKGKNGRVHVLKYNDRRAVSAQYHDLLRTLLARAKTVSLPR